MRQPATTARCKRDASAALLSLPETAAALGVSTSTMRRHVRAGCPQAVGGHRGQGCPALFDPAAVRAWLDSRRGGASVDYARVIAADFPQIASAALWGAFQGVADKDRRTVAPHLADAWLRLTRQFIDRIRQDVPDMARPDCLPFEIQQLDRYRMQR